jgi:hypothetical protein
VEYVGEIHNGPRGGLIYADACLTNRFEVDDAVSEVLLKTATGGMAAYVGNTRFGWMGTGAEIERAFWRYLPVMRNVGLLHNTKAWYADSDAGCWTNFSLNLLGCPEMPLWFGSPEGLVVNHPSSVLPPSSIDVLVKSPEGTPLGDARVCMTDADDLFELHFTDAAGRTVFSTAGLATGSTVRITVTMRNRIPYQGTVDLFISSRFIRGDSNVDGVLDISDAVAILGFLFLGSASLSCDDAADVNDDGALDLSDAVKLLGCLFLGDQLPPGTTPGQMQQDPTPDNLGCDFYPRGMQGY